MKTRLLRTIAATAIEAVQIHQASLEGTQPTPAMSVTSSAIREPAPISLHGSRTPEVRNCVWEDGLLFCRATTCCLACVDGYDNCTYGC
jgi:hypothetical protein